MNQTIVYAYTKNRKIASVIYVIVMFVIQAVLLYKYCSGIAIFNGRAINIFVALDLILNLFNESVFIHLAMNFIVGGAYYLILIILVKKTLGIIKLLKYPFQVLSYDTMQDHQFWNLFWIGDGVIKTYGCICLYAVLVCFLKEYQLSNDVLWLACLGPIALLLMRAHILLLRDYGVKKIAIQLMYMLILITSVTMILYHTWDSSIYNIRLTFASHNNNPSTTAKDILQTVCQIAQSVMLILTSLQTIRLIKTIMDFPEKTEENARSCVKKILIFAVSSVGVQIAALLFKGGYINVAKIINIILPNIPLMAAGVALLLYTYLTIEKDDPTSSVSTENTATESEIEATT